MESPTKVLSEEHKHILCVVDALARECNALGSGKELDRTFFEKAIDFIRNYADRFHHAKEEKILFAELCRPNARMHCNPVQQMLYEHDLRRNFVRELEEGVRKGDRDKIVESGLGYAALLREHIFKEDNILYPMADDALDPGIQRSMMERFEQAECERFSVGAKKKYLSIAEEFEKRG